MKKTKNEQSVGDDVNNAERMRPTKAQAKTTREKAKLDASLGSDELSTKERILRAGLRVFGLRGYQGARTAEIGRIAGVPQPLIYFHFDDKLDLWKACASYSIRITLEREENVTRQLRTLDANEALTFLLKNVVQRAHDDPDMARFYMRFGVEKGLNPDLDCPPGFTHGVELFRSNVRYLQDQGALPAEINSTILAYMLVGSAVHLYWNLADYEQLTGKSLDEELVVEQHLAAMMRIYSGR